MNAQVVFIVKQVNHKRSDTDGECPPSTQSIPDVSGYDACPAFNPMRDDLHGDRSFKDQARFIAVTPPNVGVDRWQVSELHYSAVSLRQRKIGPNSRSKAGNIADRYAEVTASC